MTVDHAESPLNVPTAIRSGYGSPTVFVDIDLCVDYCGADREDSRSVSLHVNTTPSVNTELDSPVVPCSCMQVCRTISLTDRDSTMAHAVLIGQTGVLIARTGEFCFVPQTAGTCEFTREAIDLWGVVAMDDLRVTVTFDSLPSLYLTSGLETTATRKQTGRIPGGQDQDIATVEWDADVCASGVHFSRHEAGDVSATGKMVMVT